MKNCYKQSLDCASRLGLKSIAFPAISTGVYGFPKELAAEVTSRAIEDFLKDHDEVEEVRLVFFSGTDASTFLTHHKFSE